MGQTDAKHLATQISQLVHPKGNRAADSQHVLISIHRRRRDRFRPDDKDEHDRVEVPVNTV